MVHVTLTASIDVSLILPTTSPAPITYFESSRRSARNLRRMFSRVVRFEPECTTCAVTSKSARIFGLIFWKRVCVFKPILVPWRFNFSYPGIDSIVIVMSSRAVSEASKSSAVTEGTVASRRHSVASRRGDGTKAIDAMMMVTRLSDAHYQNQIIAGHPALAIRTFLRRCRFCIIAPATAACASRIHGERWGRNRLPPSDRSVAKSGSRCGGLLHGPDGDIPGK